MATEFSTTVPGYQLCQVIEQQVLTDPKSTFSARFLQMLLFLLWQRYS